MPNQWRQFVFLLNDHLRDLRESWMTGLALVAVWLSIIGVGILLPLVGMPLAMLTGADEPTAVFMLSTVAVALIILALSAILVTRMLRQGAARRYDGWAAGGMAADVIRVILLTILLSIISAVLSWVILAVLAVVGGLLGFAIGTLLALSGLFGGDNPIDVLGDALRAGLGDQMLPAVLAAGGALVTTLVSAWVAARFSPALAGAVAMRRFVTFEAWRWTSGQWGPAFLVMLVAGAPVGLLEVIAPLLGSGPAAIAVAMLTTVVALACTVAQILLGLAVWRRTASQEALDEAAWRPDGETARLLPVAGLD